MTEEEEKIFLANKEKVYEYLKRIDLVDFIGKEAGASFVRRSSRWWALCPFPFHKEKTSSFHCSSKDGVWRFYCFGCHNHGSIIDFCIHYNSLGSPEEAMLFLADKLGLKENLAWMSQEISKVNIKIDKIRKIETAHFVACNRCRSLLRKYRKARSVGMWVGKQYKAMNTIMSNINDENVDEKMERLERIMEKAFSALVNPDVISISPEVVHASS